MIFFFLLACFHSLTAKRLTSTSPTGSGLCLGTITPVFTQLNKSMILIICSGAIIVLAAKLGLLKITAPCVGPSNVFDPECVGGKSWMMVCLSHFWPSYLYYTVDHYSNRYFRTSPETPRQDLQVSPFNSHTKYSYPQIQHMYMYI